MNIGRIVEGYCRVPLRGRRVVGGCCCCYCVVHSSSSWGHLIVLTRGGGKSVVGVVKNTSVGGHLGGPNFLRGWSVVWRYTIVRARSVGSHMMHTSGGYVHVVLRGSHGVINIYA